MARANTPPMYQTAHHCGERMVITTDAIGRQRKRCPRCDGVARLATRMAPEHAARSQAQWAPPVAPVTPPKNRAALVILPEVKAFVEVRERPAPLPSKYVKSEAETHPKDLPADHPRAIRYREKLSATRKATLARKRAKREAMLRPKGAAEDVR